MSEAYTIALQTQAKGHELHSNYVACCYFCKIEKALGTKQMPLQLHQPRAIR
jgi:hypothetical protein